MKDKRITIPHGTKIKSPVDQNVYIIENVIGLGGSCVAYDAYYTDKYNIHHNCIIKQLHPVSADYKSAWNEVKVTECELDRFIKTSSLQCTVSKESETINSTSVIRSVFSYNDNIYFQVSEKSRGISLDKMIFDDIQDYIPVICKIAKTICAYHSQGWLHLDIKPQNIFCRYDGNGAVNISMFDFDSMIKSDNIEDSSVVLAYSKEYAPYELTTGKRSKIGVSSDYYEISCMMFKKIFGRLPKPTEISGFCKFNFNECKMPVIRNSELTYALQDFFKHTLTVNIDKRYSSDDKFIQALENLRKLTRIQKPAILSNFTTPSTYFIGRASETDSIRNRLLNSGKVIIQGVGGIGKSSLALHYADTFKYEYKNILYLEYSDSFEELVKNEISILNISSEMTIEDKMKIFKELCNERVLVIIDNLDHIDYEQLKEYWFMLNCHLIITSRGNNEKYIDYTVSLSGIKEAQKLFFHYYTSPYSDLEKKYVDEILYSINSHTMMTELLGKFCNNSYIENNRSNLEEVWKAFNHFNMESVGNNKVKQLKDWIPDNRSIQEHIDILFSIFSFSDSEIYILNVLSLLGLKSVSENLLNSWCSDYDSASLSKLKAIGIIQFNDKTGYKLHPLIIDRVLYNFRPDAKRMQGLTEHIADSLSASKIKNRAMLIRISEYYSGHIFGSHRSLAYMYQILYCKSPREKKKKYLDKAIQMYSELDNGKIPAYFKLKEIEKEYLNTSTLYEEDLIHKEELGNIFILECEKELNYNYDYKIVQNFELIAGIFSVLSNHDIFSMSEKLIKSFYEYQLMFLEKAMKSCISEADKKRIAEKIYNCYDDMFSPVHNSAKAEKYKQIADMGIKFFRNGVRIEESEQEKEARLLEAFIEDNQKDEYLSIADKWFEKYKKDSIELDHYLRFLMESVYENTNQWDKYLVLVQGEDKITGYDKSLNLGKAFFHLKNRDKTNKFLLNSIDYYSEQVSEALNYDMERYLISVGYFIINNMFIQNVDKYENLFISQAEKYYESSMFEKADDLAVLCLALCKEYQKKAMLSTVIDFFRMNSHDVLKMEENKSKAIVFLNLYSRFRDASITDEDEYKEFIKLSEKLITENTEFFWIKIFRADYYEKHEMSETALEEYVKIIELLSLRDTASSSTKKLIQYTLCKIELCDFSFFYENYRFDIDYELIYYLMNHGKENSESFSNIINNKIQIVRDYERIDSEHGKIILKNIIAETDSFNQDFSEKMSALEYIEKYYSNKKQIDNAIDFALKRFELCEDIDDKSLICCNIADYYKLQGKTEYQLEWLKKAYEYSKQSEKDSHKNIERLLLVHKKLAEFYSAENNVEMQIKENHNIEKIILSRCLENYEKDLANAYNSLNKLYMQTHNLTKAYFYSSMAEILLQKSIP